MYLPRSTHAQYPALWMGTWALGGMHFGPTNYQESLRVINRAFELGIRYFDTAHFYAKGQADRLLRPLCQSHRHDLFISAKGGLNWDNNTVIHDASPQSLRRALEASLTAMGTDYIDLFSLHHPDPKIQWDTVKSTLVQFQTEGLIRFWGVSNMTVDDDVPHQIHFNPIHRDPLPQSSFTVAYSPLEQGLLSLKNYQLGKKDSRNRNPYFNNAQVQHWLLQFNHLCNAFNTSPISATLRWIMDQDKINALILGPKTVLQLETLWSGCHQPDVIPNPLWDHLTHGISVTNPLEKHTNKSRLDIKI